MKVILLAGVLVFAGVACGGDGDAAGDATPTTGGTTTTIQATDALKFEPETVTVSVGSTVTWQAGSTQPHDANSDTGAPVAFKVDLPAGKSGTFTFATAGTYPYYCTIHGKSMKGTITVQ